MLKHILVPLDGSQVALKALDFVTQVCDDQCDITLLTAVQLPDFPIYGASPLVEIEREYRPPLDSACDLAAHYLQEIAASVDKTGYHVHTRVEIGEPALVIAQVANELAVDMIVMSTHSRSGISHWLFGSTTSRVLGAASRPIMVIPSRAMEQ